MSNSDDELADLERQVELKMAASQEQEFSNSVSNYNEDQDVPSYLDSTYQNSTTPTPITTEMVIISISKRMMLLFFFFLIEIFYFFLYFFFFLFLV